MLDRPQIESQVNNIANISYLNYKANKSDDEYFKKVEEFVKKFLKTIGRTSGWFVKLNQIQIIIL